MIGKRLLEERTATRRGTTNGISLYSETGCHFSEEPTNNRPAFRAEPEKVEEDAIKKEAGEIGVSRTDELRLETC